MPPQILIQDVEHYQFVFALSEKKGSREDNVADGIVTNTIMAAPDTLLGVVTI